MFCRFIFKNKNKHNLVKFKLQKSFQAKSTQLHEIRTDTNWLRPQSNRNPETESGRPEPLHMEGKKCQKPIGFAFKLTLRLYQDGK